jgi:hypothetical protein
MVTLPTAQKTANPFARLLDPIDRVSEILFGLIMVLTITSTFSVVSSGRADVKLMVLGALGCNLAWGIIDGCLYLMGCLNDRARGPLLIRALRRTGDRGEANQMVADALPPEIAAALSDQELDEVRGKLLRQPEVTFRPSLSKEDLLAAFAIAVLVFLSTFPVVIPFFFFQDAQLALRISNAIAVVLLFACGYLLGQIIGGRSWITGGAMIVLGCALVAVAAALGG